MAMSWLCHFSDVIGLHTGNFHRNDYLMLHHLAGATIQVETLVNSIFNRTAMTQERNQSYATISRLRSESFHCSYVYVCTNIEYTGPPTLYVLIDKYRVYCTF